MKRVLVLGVGAQGSTVAQRLDEEPSVSEIICADYDPQAVDELVKILDKAKGFRVDASKKQDIVEIAGDVDLIVNGLPLNLGKNVLEAALEVKADYQDFATTESLCPPQEYLRNYDVLFDEYGPRFEAIGKTAVIATGAAPGLIHVAAREAMKYLDSCETITLLVYEGVAAKRFLPFWWSPSTAIGDMVWDGYSFEDGQVRSNTAHSRPVYRKFNGFDREVKLVEHAHDEPILMGRNAKEFFKGARNIFFKYGGAGQLFAEPLFKMGMLSNKPVELDGNQVIPLNLVKKLLPPAPKFKGEIQEILDEGLVSDTGAMVIESTGVKDGERVMVETYVYSPGCAEAFERSGLTAEMYQTGQCGVLFTKMFLEGRYTQKGLISSDMLTFEQVDYYLEEAAKYDIRTEVTVREI